MIEHGYCRKHTPQINSEYEDEGVWPQTHKDEWCFEAESDRNKYKDPYNHDPYSSVI